MRNWFYEQMAMYSAYHRDYRNQLTHHLGVPMIVFSLLVLTSKVTIYANEGGGPITLAIVLMTTLLLVYVLCTPLIGTIAVLIYGALLYYADQTRILEMTYVWQIFGVFFVGGWAIQFAGHVFEKRKPALFDNLMQIFMAPAFLIAEVVFAIGLEKSLKSEIESRMGPYMPKSE